MSGVRSVSRFITLHVNVQLFQHHFWKRLSFALLCCLSSVEKQQLTIFMCLCSGLCMLFHSFTCSFADTTLTWLLCLYKSLKSGGVCAPDLFLNIVIGLPWWLSGKEFICNAGDAGLIPGLGRSTEEGNGNPLRYS